MQQQTLQQQTTTNTATMNAATMNAATTNVATTNAATTIATTNSATTDAGGRGHKSAHPVVVVSCRLGRYVWRSPHQSYSSLPHGEWVVKPHATWIHSDHKGEPYIPKPFVGRKREYLAKKANIWVQKGWANAWASSQGYYVGVLGLWELIFLKSLPHPLCLWGAETCHNGMGTYRGNMYAR